MAFETVSNRNTPTPIIVQSGSYMESISNTDYHAETEHLSSSKIKKAHQTSAHYRWSLENDSYDNESWSENSAKDYGSLVHALALEHPTDPDILSREFAFMDCIGRNWRTKVDREYKAQFLKENAGKIVVPAYKLDTAKRAVDAIKAHPFANELIFGPGRSEASGFTVCPHSGRKIKVRLDRENFKHGIVDLKTTASITEFEKIAKWVCDYDLSAYMYVLADSLITGEIKDYYFVVVDAEMRVEVRKAGERFLAGGQKKYERAMGNIGIALDDKKSPTVRWQETDCEEI
jgi:hypothetical protein